MDYKIPFRGLKEGKHEYVFSIDNKFFENFPESVLVARARFMMGEVLFKSGRYQEALAALEGFDRSAERKFLEPVLYYRGCAFFETGRFEESVRSLETLLTRWPGSSLFFDAKLLQGRVYAAAGQRGEAVRVLSDVLNFARDDLLIHRASLALGRAQNDSGEKLASFQRVVLLADPTDEAQAELIAEALYESLPLYFELARYDDLLADTDRLVSEFPNAGTVDAASVWRAQALQKKRELTVDDADLNG